MINPKAHIGNKGFDLLVTLSVFFCLESFSFAMFPYPVGFMVCIIHDHLSRFQTLAHSRPKL